MAIRHDFALESLTDFPDDALAAPEPITAGHLDEMMARLRECGIRRVSWGDVTGDGSAGAFIPAHDSRWRNYAVTYHGLGQDTLKAAVSAAHRHGLEIYGYFKPYETGPSAVFPEGSYEAMLFGRLRHLGGRLSWIDPFVADHPHLRIRRCTHDLPGNIRDIPVARLALRKRDEAPTRITPEHLQIWTSDLNYRYRRIDAPFRVTETVMPCQRDTFELFKGKAVTRKGEPQRVLILDGLCIRDRYVLVTTDFAEGTADFENTDTGMLAAFDEKGNEIAGVIASGSGIWFADRIDFRNWGLSYDLGYGGQLMRLDEPNKSGRHGIVAFTRGRNEYLPAALCETEPEVQSFWLRCIERMLDDGVDGIDFREENHSTHTNHPEEYGYNDAVLEKCRQRGREDTGMIAQVRGDAYTGFLARAKSAINRRGKMMRIHFQVDWYRPDPVMHRRLAYPANLDFQWRKWLERGLTDEAVLRSFSTPFDGLFNDPVAEELIQRCREKNIPLSVNRYINKDTLSDDYMRVRNDGRFAGFILYETANFLEFKAAGGCVISLPSAAGLRNR